MDWGDFLRNLGPGIGSQVSGFYGQQEGDPIIDPGDGSAPYYTGGGYNPYTTISPYRYSHLRPEDNPGDRLYADLIRAQTSDYLTRFAPIENYLAGQVTATGTRSLPGDLERTRGAVLGAGMNVQGMQNRQSERYGLAPTSNIGTSNSTVSALVGGLNDTRMRDADRRLALLSGGLSGLSQKARNIAG